MISSHVLIAWNEAKVLKVFGNTITLENSSFLRSPLLFDSWSHLTVALVLVLWKTIATGGFGIFFYTIPFKAEYKSRNSN